MGLSTWEASQKYKLSSSYLRKLLAKKALKGKEVPISAKRKIWLINEASLKKFLRTVRKPGPKPSK